jgi:hypothetical protein
VPSSRRGRLTLPEMIRADPRHPWFSSFFTTQIDILHRSATGRRKIRNKPGRKKTPRVLFRTRGAYLSDCGVRLWRPWLTGAAVDFDVGWRDLRKPADGMPTVCLESDEQPARENRSD